MDILFISVWFPYPMDNGARIRIWHLLRALGERHRVHFVGFIPTDSEYQYLPDLYKYCKEIDVVKRDPFWHDPKQRFSAHLSRKPRDVLRGYSPEMSQLIKTVLEQQSFDVVVASTMVIAQYALLAKATPRILEEQNFSTLWMEERYRDQTNWLRRLAGWITWQKCRDYERRLYPQFQAVTMVSERDRQAVKSSLPGYAGRLEVIPNGVDLETRCMGLAEPVADTLVFNGALTYAANLEAMRYFIQNIWPLIRQERPAACLKITGRLEGLDLSWLPGEAGVMLTGYLEDVRPVVAGSWLAIAPLRDGGGTRLKILEAMALGTPVVATTKGAEGLHVTHNKDILIADQPRAFADHCLRLLQDPSLRAVLAVNARRLVEQCYGWQAIGEQFCRLVEAL